MSRLFDDAQSEYLKREAAVPISAYPFAMACKFRVNDDSQNNVLMWLGDKDVDTHNCVVAAAGDAQSQSIRVNTANYGGGSTGNALSSAGYTQDVWSHAAGIWLNVSERHAYIDGGNKGSNTDTVGALANHDSIAIGVNFRSTIGGYASGDIAEAAIWDLTDWGANDAERETAFEAALVGLAAGESPENYPTGLIAYWPLRDDDEDDAGSFNLTPINTPSWSAHPTVIYHLAGDLDAQSALTGNAKSIQTLAGSLGGQSALSGNLVQPYTIVIAATASTTIDPYFEFPSGTIEAKVNGISEGFFTSGVPKDIVVVDEDVIEYICSDWDAITVIDFWNSSVGGSVAGWVLPSSLEELYFTNTSISGDISGWPDLSLLNTLELDNSQVDYDSSTGSFEDAQNGLEIDFYNCLLTETQVDNVLLDLVTSAATNGILDIDGNDAAPSPSGLTSKATLVSRGWTVGTTTAIFSLAGLIATQSTVTGTLNTIITQSLAGAIAAQSSAAAYLQFCYTDIPPMMHEDLIDPYGDMGAWLWLAEIVVPTQTTQRIARNTATFVYGVTPFMASNFDVGRIPLAGDGSVPRIQLRVAQDETGALEDIVNATKGGENGTITLIRTCEKYFDSPVKALERTYDILTAGSDSQWVTFVLGIPNPLTQRIPLWSYSSKVCPLATPSLFKGPRCQYAGEDAVCTGLLEDCYTKGNAAHWGAEAGLDPAAVRI